MLGVKGSSRELKWTAFFSVLEPRPSSPEKGTQGASVPAEFLPLPALPVPPSPPPPLHPPRPSLRPCPDLVCDDISRPRGLQGGPWPLLRGTQAPAALVEIPEARLLRRVGGRGPQGWAAPRGRCRGKRCSAPQAAVGLGCLCSSPSPSPLAGLRVVSTRSFLPALCLYPLLVAALTWCVAFEMKGPFRSLETGA